MFPRALVLSVCLFLSGFAGLIYEVLWSRQFGLVMGQTVYALSTIVSTFLGGLALGAWLGGRWTRRHGASLRLYAAMELAIGVTAVCVPVLVHWLDPVLGVAYRSVGSSLLAYSLVQFALCAGVVLVPTVLMGATLPVATTILVEERSDVTAGVGLLYAMNTLGGAVGAAVAGFVLLPQIGMAATSTVAACLNAAVGLIAFASARGATNARPVVASVDVGTPAGASHPTQWGGRPTSLALLYGVSGFAALCLEVGWARLVGLSIGSTTYGFTIILVGFITGIGLGSFISPRIAFLRRDPLRGIFLLHAIIALAGMFSVAYLGRLPSIVLPLAADPDIGPTGLIFYELLLVFATIAVPTLAMGGIFPLLATLLHRGVGGAGYAAGVAYSANTIGNILGSLVAGFVLVPLIGMRASIIAASALSGLAGVGYLLPKLRAGSTAAWTQAGALVAVMALAAMMVPAWQPKLLLSAPFLAAPRNPGTRAGWVPNPLTLGEIVFFREGASTVVAVAKSFGGFSLFQDGINESSTLGALQRFIGHLPILLHGDAKRALVIGLGGGHTLSAVATHPLEQIDCVEISPEVVDATREYFVHDGLDDPRVRLRIGDGRNHLRHSGETYDVIVSQPSHVWLAGASSLFTRDFFSEVRDHLAPGGVAASWFYAYTEEARRSIIGAFTEAFPTAFLFNNSGMPSLLIGLKDGQRLSAAKVARALAASAEKGAADRVGERDPADILGGLIAASTRMREYAAAVPANTDDNAYVAFLGLGEAVAQPFTALTALQEDPVPYIDPTLDSAQETEAFIERLRSAVAKRSAGLSPQPN